MFCCTFCKGVCIGCLLSVIYYIRRERSLFKPAEVYLDLLSPSSGSQRNLNKHCRHAYGAIGSAILLFAVACSVIPLQLWQTNLQSLLTDRSLPVLPAQDQKKKQKKTATDCSFKNSSILRNTERFIW